MTTQFPFLRLPGEIRNLVYEFALSEPNGLFYIPCSLGRLISRPLICRKYQKYYSGSRIVLCDGHDLETNPHYTREEMVTTRCGIVIANQLQFVSKQLRHETRGIGARFNNITIMEYNDESRPECKWAFSDLIAAIPEAEITHLRKITVEAYNYLDPRIQKGVQNSNIRTLDSAVDLCRRHPKLRLHIYARNFDPYKRNVFHGAAVWLKRVRGDTSYLLRIYNPKKSRGKVLEGWFETAGLQELFVQVPENLRFFPRFFQFDESSFRLCYANADWTLAAVPNGLDGLVELMKEWYEHGI
ncbi:hypothetical protein BS50DRAFT_651690 [Corynespora cassiicola Philippines]|uniref:F-box domain-containing protein n=1 Tax=Corynespora cassiicola Philippines TaxID=1448308 RepID=A0A2T2N7U6_CORCC|nr:hypothetical protein BS50DRAFT_651690 [Corynespora cassiicola Philippines]